MNKVLFTLGITAISIFLSCGGSGSAPIVGGPCTYSSTPGTSTITKLVSVTDGIEAHFNFVPTDSNATKNPSDSDNHLVLSSGLPTQQWIDYQNIIVGSELNTTRQNILTGTCTPIMYTFSTLPDNPHGM